MGLASNHGVVVQVDEGEEIAAVELRHRFWEGHSYGRNVTFGLFLTVFRVTRASDPAVCFWYDYIALF